MQVLMRDLRVHYDEWIQDGYVARKRWRLHPGEDLNRLRTEAQSTTAQMESAIAHQSRKLSAVVAVKEAWE